MQNGVSEKVAIIVQFYAAFFTGFIIAYVRSWRLALALTSILPCIAIAGGLMNVFVSKYIAKSRDSVSEGGTLAEEVISTIRTAQAFGTQKTLADKYDKTIEESHLLDVKAALASGIGLAAFFFVIYSGYGLSFSFGTTLIMRGLADPGVVVNVFFAILIGSFSLAMAAPEQQGMMVYMILVSWKFTKCNSVYSNFERQGCGSEALPNNRSGTNH